MKREIPIRQVPSKSEQDKIIDDLWQKPEEKQQETNSETIASIDTSIKQIIFSLIVLVLSIFAITSYIHMNYGKYGTMRKIDNLVEQRHSYENNKRLYEKQAKDEQTKIDSVLKEELQNKNELKEKWNTIYQ